MADGGVVFGPGSALTANGVPLGQCKSFSFEPTPGSVAEMNGYAEWKATFFPEAVVPHSASMTVIEGRKWWQWIIPLRTLYEADAVRYESGYKVIGDEFEYTFTSNEPFTKRYKWVWKT